MMVCTHALLIQCQCPELIDTSSTSLFSKLLQGDICKTNAIHILAYVVG